MAGVKNQNLLEIVSDVQKYAVYTSSNVSYIILQEEAYTSFLLLLNKKLEDSQIHNASYIFKQAGLPISYKFHFFHPYGMVENLIWTGLDSLKEQKLVKEINFDVERVYQPTSNLRLLQNDLEDRIPTKHKTLIQKVRDTFLVRSGRNLQKMAILLYLDYLESELGIEEDTRQRFYTACNINENDIIILQKQWEEITSI